MMVSGDQSSRLDTKTCAQSRAKELISAAANDPTITVQICELYEFADTLPPLTSQELIGEWSGGGFSTEHPFHIWLRSINWIGVTIRAEDDVQPIVVAAHTRDGPHKRRRWLDEWGNGEVLEVKYRGVVSAALFCDNHPVVTHFRKVSDTALLGIMTGKLYRESGPFFFYLTR